MTPELRTASSSRAERQGKVTLDRILAALETHVAGADLGTLSAACGAAPECAALEVEAGITAGVLERWPFWADRIRATGERATPFLAELATLRWRATPFLQIISHSSGWPATLHLLVPGAHAVVERFPWHGDAAELARERAGYARPRPLREGATAMAILAHLPEAARAALLGREAVEERRDLLESVRAQGYCLRRGTQVAGSWVLSAPLRTAHGLPYGALCTYGFADLLPPEFAATATATVRQCALDLSQLADVPALGQRAQAIIEGLAAPR